MITEKYFSAILDDCRANGLGSERTILRAMIGLWFSPAVRILLSHRIQYRLRKKGGSFRIALARFLWMRTLNKWGCDIGNQAEISPGVCLPHPNGVVIANFSTIEKGVTIFQGVTIGARRRGRSGRPTIKKGSTIYAKASVLGEVSIGPDVVVSAHAVIMDDVKEGGAPTTSSHKILPSKKVSNDKGPKTFSRLLGGRKRAA